MVEKNLDVAAMGLEEMIDGLESSITRGGFDNDSVVGLIKFWTVVNLYCGLTLRSWGYWRMKRVPPALAKGQKRSKELLRALESYQNTLGPGRESGDYWVRADDALMNFVFDYRLHIEDDVDKETDFLHQINQMMSAGPDALVENGGVLR
jgi:hypothetical protein